MQTNENKWCDGVIFRCQECTAKEKCQAPKKKLIVLIDATNGQKLDLSDYLIDGPR